MENLQPAILRHWHTQCENLQLSSKDFYRQVSKRIKEKSYPKVGTSVETRGQGVFSDGRLYLSVTSGRHEYLICAAPFGRDFFFSWYLLVDFGGLELFGLIPFIGPWIMRRLLSKTYFENDSELMFLECIRRIVDDAVQEATREQGVRQAVEIETA